MSSATRRPAPVGMATSEELRQLPRPVHRYFKRVLSEAQHPIRAMHMSQSGKLRTELHREKWMRFRADHVVRPPSRSFHWDAKVDILPLLHMRVRDGYANGVGSGQVQLLSAVTVASDRDKPELNSSSLHRFLAEAVWYPTALLPSAGVQWDPIDDTRALATLADCGNTVSLEFRFNDADEAIAIYTPGRLRRLGKAYVLTPWEGHFNDYRRHQGMLVPSAGEVGWYTDERLEIVWNADITSLEYEFGQI